MKISTFAISCVTLTASVSAFTTSPLFLSRGVAPIQHAALRMTADDEAKSSPVNDFKEKQSRTRTDDNNKVSLLRPYPWFVPTLIKEMNLDY